MKYKILSLICSLMILITLTAPVVAESGVEITGVEDIRKYTEMPLTEKQLQKMLDDTHPTNPALFEERAKAKSTVAAYGQVPLKKGEDAYDWWISLQRITTSVQQNKAIAEYLLKNDGFVSGYGCNVYGFITVYLDVNKKDQIKPEELENIKQVFEKYAENEGIKDLPIAFVNYKSNLILDASSGDKVRPVKGGYEISIINNSSAVHASTGTIGYPAVQNNNPSKRGFVTAAHMFVNNSVVNTSSLVYQPNPSVSNKINVVSIVQNYTKLDAAYVAMNNSSVSPILFVGTDPVLANNSSRSNENKTQMVIYGSTPAPGGEIRRYGIKTGNNGGNFIEYNYDYDLGYHNIVLNKVGVMNASAGSVVSNGGDSGGPVYVGMNVTIGSGNKPKTDYHAFIIGTTVGHIDGNATPDPDVYEFSFPVTIYTPHGEINDYLNVKPYTSQSMILT